METVKKALLVGFVLVGVILVVAVWTQGLMDTDISGSVSYRTTGTVSDTMIVPQTATPQGTPLGIDNSTSVYTNRTPIVVPKASATPTETLSPEKIQEYMTEEIDQ